MPDMQAIGKRFLTALRSSLFVSVRKRLISSIYLVSFRKAPIVEIDHFVSVTPLYTDILLSKNVFAILFNF